MPYIVRKTMAEIFQERVKATPKAIGFQFKEGGQWKQLSFQDFHDECRLISAGLRSLGLAKGDRAAILSGTRVEWALSDMAILGTGAVSVPVYASNTAEDVAFILGHSGAKIALVEDVTQLDKILEKREALPELQSIVLFDSRGMAAAATRKDVLSLAALRELGKREESREPRKFEETLRAAQPSDLFTICYTSGTTGVPKGAMLTHENFVSVMEDVVRAVGKYTEPETETLLAFLPFSHVLGRLESLATYVFGWKECYAESVDHLLRNMAEVRPTLIVAVPRVFEKAYLRIRQSMEEAPASRRKLYEWALEAAKHRNTAAGKARAALADALVFRKIRARFGGRLKFAICGGAPLPSEIAEYFYTVGVPLLEGYGLTETSAPVSVNLPNSYRIGTVGKPLADVQVRIASDGEILIKSKKVFSGYYKMPDETAEALQDGWLRTGDIGFLDDEGFLHITDRKKDLIITSGGKNVAPQKIESLAKLNPVINQIVVLGDRRNYLTALVTVDQDQITRYAQEHQILFSEFKELVKNPKIQSLVQKAVDDLNSQLPSFETIKRFIVLDQQFSIESGELTPSLKIKRRWVQEKYKDEIDRMYGVDSANKIR